MLADESHHRDVNHALAPLSADTLGLGFVGSTSSSRKHQHQHLPLAAPLPGLPRWPPCLRPLLCLVSPGEGSRSQRRGVISQGESITRSRRPARYALTSALFTPGLDAPRSALRLRQPLRARAPGLVEVVVAVVLVLVLVVVVAVVVVVSHFTWPVTNHTLLHPNPTSPTTTSP